MGLIIYALLFIPFFVVPGLLLPVALVRWLSPRRHPDADFIYILSQTMCLLIVKCFYRTRILNPENVPAKGGALLIANHVSYVDVIVLGAYSPRPIRFMSWEGFENNFLLRIVMRSMKTIPVSPLRAKEAIRRACDKLKAGELVCIFPEGQLTRTGALNEFRPGYELIARISKVPVYPAFVDGLWGSVFSHRHGAPFRQTPTSWPRPITVRFGPVLADTAMVHARNALLDLGAEAFADRPEMGRHIAGAVVRAACAKPGVEAVVDRAAGKTVFTAARTVAVARVFAKRLKEIAPEKRVGLILPPGVPGTVVNLACLFAGKTPVNLNFTLGRTALEHCFAKADIRTVLTIDAFRAKVSEKMDVPWPENTVDMLTELKALNKGAVIANEIAVRALPGGLVTTLWGIPCQGGDAEAALLFTSGSAGTPKGVVLSHRNILSNAEQIFESGIVPDEGCLLSNLPIFHSFGHTVGIWFSLVRGVRCVCLPSPLDAKRNIEVIREEKVNTLIGTPTFYRGYLKKVTPGEKTTIERIIAGAEKTPAGFAAECEEKLGGRYFEGYGATETSPVVAVNVPDVADEDAPGGIRKGSKPGSVGRLIAGMTARVYSPLTGEALGFNETGLLSLKGANVFSGYLDDPAKTAESLKDGWYATGDLARIDEEGFIFIEGRLARFSKIAGEMVPHGAIEDAVVAAFGLPQDGEPQVAVSCRADAQKGEAVVLLTTVDIEAEDLRQKLTAAGLANLWVPKVIKKVPAIPVLATGKLDLRALKELAAE
jgi:acyl-[acyl-carrier-protein]-phospholipid O-acyltransferase/long-chain-fatty-acid--[acyl-carrier-protein] ligase